MQINFSVSVSVDHSNGRILAVYFQLRSGKVAQTRELVDGRVTADYDRKGKLLGIEMIAPCSAKVLDKIEIEEDAKEFLKRAVPREFIRGKLPASPALVG